MCPPRIREKKMHQDRFKQMCRVNKELLTHHRRLLDQGHGQAPAPHPPVKKECCQQPAIHLHGRQPRRFRATETNITTFIIVIYERPPASGGREHVS